MLTELEEYMKTENLEINKKEILELKSTITAMKNALEEFKVRFEQA